MVGNGTSSKLKTINIKREGTSLLFCVRLIILRLQIKMFKPIKVGGIQITDQLLLRRLMDGSVNLRAAVLISQKLSEGAYKDADEAIEDLGVMQPVNNRKGFEIIDMLYKQKDQDLMEMFAPEKHSHGISEALFGKILRMAKGMAQPHTLCCYIEILKEHKKASI